MADTVAVECPKCGKEFEVNSVEETGADRESAVTCSGNFAVEDGAVVDYKERAKNLHEDVVVGFVVQKKGE